MATPAGTRAYGAADGAIFVYEAPEPTAGAGLIAAAASLPWLSRRRRQGAASETAVR